MTTSMERGRASMGSRKKPQMLGSTILSLYLIHFQAVFTGTGLPAGLRFVQLGLLCGALVAGPSMLYIFFTTGQAKNSDITLEGTGCRILLLTAAVSVSLLGTLASTFAAGGGAWSAARLRKIKIAPGPTGFPIIGSAREMQGLAHRKLHQLAKELSAEKLMAFSVGCTRFVITSCPEVAAEMLRGSAFQERPLKQAAEMLLFDRAMGFATPGPYWQRLRRIAATCLFCPKQIKVNEPGRQHEGSLMLKAIGDAAATQPNSPIRLRSFLQRAAVNNMTRIVFGKRYDFGENTAAEKLEGMIRECFEVLGAFNYADHFPGLRFFEMFDVSRKCGNLVPRVKAFVQGIIDDHRSATSRDHSDVDMVDILIALEGDDKLSDFDMIAVLWEMIFRGTDTIAVTIEWALAELISHPDWQKRIHDELDAAVGNGRMVENGDMEYLPSLLACVTETFRVHPAGPLLSWARLTTKDVSIAGYDIPKGTTCMVNMWSIQHNEASHVSPDVFDPSRFSVSDGGKPMDIRGGDLRLAPFGSGRRVCPGRELALSVINLWVARLLQNFSWSSSPECPAIDMTEDLKLSCEMLRSLEAVPTLRVPLFT